MWHSQLSLLISFYLTIHPPTRNSSWTSTKTPTITPTPSSIENKAIYKLNVKLKLKLSLVKKMSCLYETLKLWIEWSILPPSPHNWDTRGWVIAAVFHGKASKLLKQQLYSWELPQYKLKYRVSYETLYAFLFAISLLMMHRGFESWIFFNNLFSWLLKIVQKYEYEGNNNRARKPTNLHRAQMIF